MTRFMHFTDLHLAGETPRHRIDDFPRAILAKLRESYQLAKSRMCSFVTFGGDWFNNHRIFSYDVIAEAMEIVCEASVPTYAVIGEHDLCGHNILTFPTSTFAFFVRRCNQLKILWEPIDLGEVVLHGKHEPDKMADVMKRTVDKSKYNILVCHELLTYNFKGPFETVNTDTLKGIPFDLIVSGDLHAGFPSHNVDSAWFCNPGSLTRRASSDAGRFPQVAIIEVVKGCSPSIELVPLKCAKLGTEVFGESIAEVARSNDTDASQFAKEMLEFEAESTNIHELVQLAGQRAKLRPEVLTYLSTKNI